MLTSLSAVPSIRPLGGLIAEGGFGVLPPGDSYLPDGGIRFLRPTEMREGNQIEWAACLRAPAEFGRHERARVLVGDIILAVKGATIAAEKSVCLIDELSEPTIVNGSIFRFQPKHAEVSGEFLLEVLSSSIARRQMKGAMILNNAVDYLSRDVIDQLLLPIPSPPEQTKLVHTMTAARAARRRKLEEAASLLGGLDVFVLETLGLTLPPAHDPNKPFAVCLRQVRDRRLDPPAYTPFPIPSNPRRVPIKPLASVAAIDSHTAPPQTDEHAIVPYVGLPECDLNDVREVASRTYKEARGRSVAKVGDILFARIEPSVFNKKYVFVEYLGGHDYAFLSTEFYAVRAHGNEDDQKYLYAMFQSAFVFNQVRGKTTGSSGRRRIDPDMFASLLIPWPDGPVRKKIAAEVSRRRNAARRLREDAAQLWDNAKRRFEEELLGLSAGSSLHLGGGM